MSRQVIKLLHESGQDSRHINDCCPAQKVHSNIRLTGPKLMIALPENFALEGEPLFH